MCTISSTITKPSQWEVSISCGKMRLMLSIECWSSLWPLLTSIAAYSTAHIKIDGGAVRAEIWDTAGQELYKSLTPMYYRGSQVLPIRTMPCCDRY